MDDKEVILELCKIELAEARLYEGQREKIVAAALAITGAAAAFFATENSANTVGGFLIWLVILTNVFATIFSITLYVRFKSRYERYRTLRNKLDDNVAGLDLKKAIADADKSWESRGIYSLASNIKVHFVWTSVPFGLAMASALFAAKYWNII